MAGSLRQFAFVGTAVAVTGGVAYALWRNYLSSQEPPGPEDQQARLRLGVQGRGTGPPAGQDKPSNKQILVLGLDGAGKTSVLYSLATNQVKRNTVPTKGFNAVCINTEETKMEFLEIGGSESLREYWKMYMPRILLLIYVVDSADHERFPVAKTLLHQLVHNNSTLPVMILANKQDLEGAHCITDIHDALALSEIGDERKIFLIGTHVAKEGLEISSGLKDTRELIAQLMSETL
ncbi:ADP-ribosylation factor-like protein 9 [Protobothrops mucrosquamatus]|uniref:ADP-ribosylation factor-like protein 9 n=1 Tax=Protobothrops mucrosquamatus TaxID=103944 RepID=UPI000775FD1E|nr:ADP-ribosylation factor-like protein 9 [Protobothrops mucrosquamatus]